jgi:hypothetical protein
MWIPNNYRSKSASKDRGEDCVFKFIKKKKGNKNVPQAIKGFVQIKKLK